MLVSNRLQNRVKTRAAIFIAAVSLTACGSNASIAKKGGTVSNTKTETPADPAAPGTTPHASSGLKKETSSEAPKPADVEATKPVSSSAPVEAPKTEPAQPAKVEPPKAPEPAQVPPADPVVETVVADPVQPVTVVEGKDGANGADGRSGADGKDGCRRAVTTSRTFKAVNVENDDYVLNNLPLVSTKKRQIGLLPLGMGGAPKKRAGTIPYVLDSQVLFKFEVALPPRASVHINHAYLKFDVMKKASDNYGDTEWFCFLDEKICSGKHNLDTYKNGKGSSYKATVNHAFWDNVSNKGNQVFSSAFSGIERKKGRNGSQVENQSLQIRIEDLIHGSTEYKTVDDFIYNHSTAANTFSQKFVAAVGDDTRVNTVELVIDYTEDTCETNRIVDEYSKSTPSMTFTLEDTLDNTPAPAVSQAPAAGVTTPAAAAPQEIPAYTPETVEPAPQAGRR